MVTTIIMKSKLKTNDRNTNTKPEHSLKLYPINNTIIYTGNSKQHHSSGKKYKNRVKHALCDKDKRKSCKYVSNGKEEKVVKK